MRQMEIIQERPLSICGVERSIPTLNWQLCRIKPDNALTLQKLNQLAEAIDRMNAAGLYYLHRALSTDYWSR